MKLHLPKTLRGALLACFASVAGVAPTVASGVLVGGTFCIALSAPFALAEDETTTEGETDSSDSTTEEESTAITFDADTNTTDGAAVYTTVSDAESLLTGKDVTVDGVTLQIGGGSGKTSGQSLDIGNSVTVTNGGMLMLWSWAGDSTQSGVTAVSVAADITLDNSALFQNDGSYHYTGAITIVGTSSITDKWGKGVSIDKLIGDESSVLELIRTETDVSSWGQQTAVFELNNANEEFEGTVKLINDEENDYVKGLKLVLKNAGALINAVLEFGSNDDVTLELAEREAMLKAVKGHGFITSSYTGGSTMTLSAADGTFTGTSASGVNWVIAGGDQGLSNASILGSYTINENAYSSFADAITLGSLTNNGTIDVSGLTSLTINDRTITDGSTLNLGTVSGYTAGNSFSYGAGYTATWNNDGTATISDTSVYWCDAGTDGISSDGEFLWSDTGNWSGGAVPGASDPVRLKADSDISRTITVNDNVSVNMMRVYGAYALNVEAEQSYSFAATNGIELYDEGSLTKTGDGTLSMSAALVQATPINVSAGILLVSDTISSAFTADLSGTGTVQLNMSTGGYCDVNLGSEFQGTTYLAYGSSMTLTGAVVGNTLRLGNGTKLQSSWATQEVNVPLVLEGTLEVHANNEKPINYNGSVTGSSIDDTTGKATVGAFTAKASANHTFKGEVNLLQFTNSNSATVTFENTLKLGTLVQSNTTKIQGETDIDTTTVNGGTLTVNAGANSVNLGAVTQAAGTVNISTSASADSLTVNGGTFNVNTGAEFTVDTLNSATVTLNGAAVLTATAVADGASVTLAQGTGSGASATLGVATDGTATVYATGIDLTVNAGGTLNIGSSSSDVISLGAFSNENSATNLYGDVTLASLSNTGTLNFAGLTSLTLGTVTARAGEKFTVGTVEGLNEAGTFNYGNGWLATYDGIDTATLSDNAIYWNDRVADADGDINWGETSNWSGSTVPTASDAVQLKNVDAISRTIVLDSDVEVSELRVYGAYTLSVENGVARTLDAAGGITLLSDTAAISKAGEGTLTVNGSLTLNAASQLTVDAGEMVVNSLVLDSSASGFTKNGAGKLSVTNSLTLNSVTVNAGELVLGSLSLDSSATGFTKNGAGTLTLGNADSLKGKDITVTEGTMAITQSGRWPARDTTAYNFKISIAEGATLTDGRNLGLTGGTVNIEGGGTYNLTSLLLSSWGSGNTTLNIKENTTLHITGTNNTSSPDSASFMVSNWSGANVINVEGTLISEALIVEKNGSATINVGNGGTLQLNAGLGGTTTDTGVVIAVGNGGMLHVNGNETSGSSGISVSMATGSTLFTSQGTTIANPITLSGDSVNVGAASGTQMTLSSALSGKSLIVPGSSSSAGGTVTFSAGLTLTGELVIEKDAVVELLGAVSLGALNNEGTLKLSENTGSLSIDDIVYKAGETYAIGTVDDGTTDGTYSTLLALIGNGGVDYLTASYADGVITFADNTTIYWDDATAGDDDLWVTADNWSHDAALTESDVVALNSGAGNKNIVFNADSAVAGVHVNDAYTFTVEDGGDYTLTAEVIYTGVDASLTKAGAGSLTISSLTADKLTVNEGTLTVGTLNSDALEVSCGADSASLIVNGISLSGDTFTKSGSGLLTLTDASGLTGKDITVQSGKMTISDSGHYAPGNTDFTIEVDSGATLTDKRYLELATGKVDITGGGMYELEGFCLSSASGTKTTLNVGVDTTLHITGTTVSTTGKTGSFMLGNWFADNAINIWGALITEAAISQRDGGATINVKDGGTLQMNAGLWAADWTATSTINVESYGNLIVNNGAAGNAVGHLTVSLADEASLFTTKGATIAETFTFAENSTVYVGAATGTTMTLSVAQSGASLRVLGSDDSVNGTAAGGTVAFTQGLTLTGALTLNSGATVNPGGTVSVGSLVNNGTVDLTGITKLSIADFNIADGETYTVGTLTGLKTAGSLDTEMGQGEYFNIAYDGTSTASVTANLVWDAQLATDDTVDAESNVWTTAADTTNWKYNNSDSAFLSDKTVVFASDTSGELSHDVVIGDNITTSAGVRILGAYNFSVADADAYTLSTGGITLGESGSFNKTGEGTLTMSLTDATAAKVIINAGTLKIDGSLSDTMADTTAGKWYESGSYEDLTAITGSGNLEITAAGDALSGNPSTRVQLSENFNGTLVVSGGQVGHSSDFGGAEQVTLTNGAGIVFNNDNDADVPDEVNTKVNIVGTGVLRAWGKYGASNPAVLAELTGDSDAVLTTNDGGYIQIDETSGFAGSLVVSGNKLILADASGSTTLADVTVNTILDVNGMNLAAGTLTTGTGSTVNVTDSTVSVTGTVTQGANSVVNLGNSTVTMADLGMVQGSTLNVNDGSALTVQKLTHGAFIDLNGTSSLTIESVADDAGSMTFAGQNSGTLSISLAEGQTFTLYHYNTGATLELASLTLGGSGTLALSDADNQIAVSLGTLSNVSGTLDVTGISSLTLADLVYAQNTVYHVGYVVDGTDDYSNLLTLIGNGGNSTLTAAYDATTGDITFSSNIWWLDDGTDGDATWATAGNWNGGDADGFDLSTSSVRLGSEATNRTIDVTSDIAAADIYVTEAYTLNVAADAAYGITSGTRVDYAESGSLTKTGAGTLTMSLAQAGNLHIAAGTVVLNDAFVDTLANYPHDLTGITAAEGTTLAVELTCPGNDIISTNCGAGWASTALDYVGITLSENFLGTLSVTGGQLYAGSNFGGAAAVRLNQAALVSDDSTGTFGVASLVIGDDGAYVNNLHNLTISSALTGTGTLTFHTGADYVANAVTTLTGSIDYDGTLSTAMKLNISSDGADIARVQIQNGGTLEVGTADTAVTVNITDGTATRTLTGETKVTVNAGSVLNDAATVVVSDGTFYTVGDGIYNLSGMQLATGGLLYQSWSNMNITGSITAADGTGSFDTSAGSVYVVGKLVLENVGISNSAVNSNAVIEVGGIWGNDHHSTFVMNTGLWADSLNTTTAVVVNVQSGSTLEVNGDNTQQTDRIDVNLRDGSILSTTTGVTLAHSSLFDQTGTVNLNAAADAVMLLTTAQSFDGLAIVGEGTVTAQGLLSGNTLSVATGATLNLTGGLTAAGSVTNDGALTLGGTVTLSSALVNNGTLTVSEGTIFDLSNLAYTDDTLLGTRTYSIVDNTGTLNGWDKTNLSIENFYLDGAQLQMGEYTYLFINENGSITLSVEQAVWDGQAEGEIYWNDDADGTQKFWSTALNDGEEKVFLSGSHVIFGTGAVTQYAITIEDDGVVAGDVTIQANSGTNADATYSFSGGSLTADSITANDDAAFDNAAVVIKEGADMSITVADGSTLSIANISTQTYEQNKEVRYYSGSFTKTGGGTLVLGSSEGDGLTAVAVQEGTLQLGTAATEDAEGTQGKLTVGTISLRGTGGTITGLTLDAATTTISMADKDSAFGTFGTLTDVSVVIGTNTGYGTLDGVQFAGTDNVLIGYLTNQNTQAQGRVGVLDGGSLTIGNLVIDMRGLGASTTGAVEKVIVMNDANKDYDINPGYTGTITNWDSDHITLVYSGAAVDANAVKVSDIDGNITIDLTQASTLYWDGMSGGAEAPGWNLTDTNWSRTEGADEDVTYTALSNLVFGNTPDVGTKTVQMATDMVAADIRVTADGYTFSGARMASLGDISVTAGAVFETTLSMVAQGAITLGHTAVPTDTTEIGDTISVNGAVEAVGNITVGGLDAVTLNAGITSHGGNIILGQGSTLENKGAVTTSGSGVLSAANGSVILGNVAEDGTVNAAYGSYTLAGNITAGSVNINLNSNHVAGGTYTTETLLTVAGAVTATDVTVRGSAGMLFSGGITATNMYVYGTDSAADTNANWVSVAAGSSLRATTLTLDDKAKLSLLGTGANFGTVYLGDAELSFDKFNGSYGTGGTTYYTTDDNATISSTSITWVTLGTVDGRVDDDNDTCHSINIISGGRSFDINRILDIKDFNLKSGVAKIAADTASAGAVHGQLLLGETSQAVLTVAQNNIMAEDSGILWLNSSILNLGSTEQTLHAGNDITMLNSTVNGAGAEGTGLNLTDDIALTYTGDNTVAAGITVAADKTLTLTAKNAEASAVAEAQSISSDNTLNIGSIISGSGNLVLNGTSGNVTLSGDNTFTGNVTVQQGITLTLNNRMSLQYADTVTLAAGSTVTSEYGELVDFDNCATLHIDTDGQLPVVLNGNLVFENNTVVKFSDIQATDAPSTDAVAVDAGNITIGGTLVLSFDSIESMKVYNIFVADNDFSGQLSDVKVALTGDWFSSNKANGYTNPYLDEAEYRLRYDAENNLLYLKSYLGKVWSGNENGDGYWTMDTELDKEYWTGWDYNNWYEYTSGIFLDLTQNVTGEDGTVTTEPMKDATVILKGGSLTGEDAVITPGNVYVESDTTVYTITTQENGSATDGVLAAGTDLHKSGTTTLYLTLDNNGTAANALGNIEVTGGSIDLGSDIAFSGTATVAAETSVTLNDNALVAGQYTVTGTGESSAVTGATLTQKTISGGTLGNVAIDGTLTTDAASSVTLSDTTLAGTGSVSDATIGSSVVIDTDATYTLSGNLAFTDTLTNSGTVTIADGSVVELGSMGYTTGANDAGATVYTYTLISGGSVTGLDEKNSYTINGVYIPSGLTESMQQHASIAFAGTQDGDWQVLITLTGVNIVQWDDRWSASEGDTFPALSAVFSSAEAKDYLDFAGDATYRYGNLVTLADDEKNAVVVSLAADSGHNNYTYAAGNATNETDIWTYDNGSAFGRIIGGLVDTDTGDDTAVTQTGDTHLYLNADGSATAVNVIAGSAGAEQVGDTYLTVEAGDYGTVIGGNSRWDGNGSVGTLTGSTHVFMDGGSVETLTVGSFIGSVTGDVNLLMTGGSVTKIHGGVDGAGTVGGNISLEIQDGTVGTLYASGAWGGSVTGDVLVRLTGGTVTNVYGVAYGDDGAGNTTVAGNVTVELGSAAGVTKLDGGASHLADGKVSTLSLTDAGATYDLTAATLTDFDRMELADGVTANVKNDLFFTAADTDVTISGDGRVVIGEWGTSAGRSTTNTIRLENNATMQVDTAYYSTSYHGSGTTYAKVFVYDSATLDITGQPKENGGDYGGSSIAINLHLDGYGKNYAGALVKGIDTVDANHGGDNASGKAQLGSIVLMDNASISSAAGTTIYQIGAYNGTTYLNLNSADYQDAGGNYTLTKLGAGIYGMVNTTVTGGTIHVAEGEVQSSLTTNAGDTDFVLQAGTALVSKAGFNKDGVANALTIRSLSGEGDVTLTAGTLTLNNLNATGYSTGTFYDEFMVENDAADNYYNNSAADMGYAYAVYSGTISGESQLKKAGTGTQYFSGTESTYTGGTDIAGGVLYLMGGTTAADFSQGSSTVTSGSVGTGSILWNGGYLYLGNGITVYNNGQAAAGQNMIIGVEAVPEGVAVSGYLGPETKTDAAGTEWVEVMTHKLFSITCNGVYENGTEYTAGSEIDPNLMLFITKEDSATATAKGFNESGYNEATYSGVLSGEGNLVKAGAGTLTIDQTNTYTSKTILWEGTLNLKGWGQFSADSTEVQAGTSVKLSYDGSYGNETTELSSDIELVGTGDARWKAESTTEKHTAALISDVGNGVEFTLSGALSGEGNLLHSGKGTLYLSGTGASSHTGGTMVTEGTVVVQKDTGLGATKEGGTAYVETLEGATLKFDDGVTTYIGAVATTDADGNTVNRGNSIEGYVEIGTGKDDAAAATLVMTGDGYWAETTTLASNAALVFNGSDASNTRKVDGTLSGARSVTGSGTLAVSDAAGTLTDSVGLTARVDAIVGYTGNIVVEGAGTELIIGSGEYAGSTDNSKGRISVSGQGAKLTAENTAVSILNGSTLSLTSNGYSDTDDTTADTAATVKAASVTIDRGATLSVTNAGTSYQYNLAGLQKAASTAVADGLQVTSEAEYENVALDSSVRATEYTYHYDASRALNTQRAGVVDTTGGLTLDAGSRYETVSANTSLAGGALTLDVSSADGVITLNLLISGLVQTFDDGNTSQIVLFSDVSSFSLYTGENYSTLTTLTNDAENADKVYSTLASSYFTGWNITEDALLVYDVAAGVVYLDGAVPEPTTGTLSVLALAALAARRRRRS